MGENTIELPPIAPPQRMTAKNPLPLAASNSNTGLPLSPGRAVVATVYWQRIVIPVSKGAPVAPRANTLLLVQVLVMAPLAQPLVRPTLSTLVPVNSPLMPPTIRMSSVARDHERARER